MRLLDSPAAEEEDVIEGTVRIIETGQVDIGALTLMFRLAQVNELWPGLRPSAAFAAGLIYGAVRQSYQPG